MSGEKLSYVEELNRSRRSTKRMLPDYLIPEKTLKSITETIRWTATSYGIWSYRILVIPRGNLRTELLPAFANQVQFANASHVILFVTAKEKYLRDVLISKSYESIVDTTIKQNKIAAINQNWKQNHVLPDEWAQKQAYIGLGTAMIAAADLKIDTCPFEGFNKDEVNKILQKHQLIDLNYEQFAVGLALGKADLKDPLVYFFEKVRMEESEFVTLIKDQK